DARHCLDLGVIDGVVPEPAGGAQSDPGSAAQLLRDALVAAVDDLARIPAADLLRQRRQKFPQMGLFSSRGPPGRVAFQQRPQGVHPGVRTKANSSESVEARRLAGLERLPPVRWRSSAGFSPVPSALNLAHTC